MKHKSFIHKHQQTCTQACTHTFRNHSRHHSESSVNTHIWNSRWAEVTQAIQGNSWCCPLVGGCSTTIPKLMSFSAQHWLMLSRFFIFFCFPLQFALFHIFCDRFGLILPGFKVQLLLGEYAHFLQPYLSVVSLSSETFGYVYVFPDQNMKFLM